MGCYENVFLSFKQIKKRYFKEQKRSTAYSRLSLLMRSGYLQSVSVGGILDEKSQVSVVYQVTRRSYELLLKMLPDQVEDEVFLNKINLSCVWHDYLLAEALWQLKLRQNDLIVKNTKIFQLGKSLFSKKPDAVLIDLKSKRQIAVELELTRKSDRRYRDIVYDYRSNNDFDSVIYITKSEVLSEKIRSVIRGKTPQGFTPRDTRKFYFISLNELFKDSNFVISNGENEILGKEAVKNFDNKGAAL